ncbi:MAG: hypothetical protein E7650_05045 [Ruminococcaceae bacterium]|nr:hypothetical protein [Oscillospiraceae bacterium]
MCQQKFVASKFKLYLFVILLSALCFGIVIQTIFIFAWKNWGYIFVIVLYALALIPVIFALGKVIYFVNVFDNGLVFKNIFKKQYYLFFADIINVHKLHLAREGTFFLIEVKGNGKAMSWNYPFKFDCTPTTCRVVDFIMTHKNTED